MLVIFVDMCWWTSIEFLIEIHTLSYKKMLFEYVVCETQPSCLGLNVLWEITFKWMIKMYCQNALQVEYISRGITNGSQHHWVIPFSLFLNSSLDLCWRKNIFRKRYPKSIILIFGLLFLFFHVAFLIHVFCTILIISLCWSDLIAVTPSDAYMRW